MIRTQLNLFGNDKYDAIDNATDEHFWAYHAGMADGDGCIRCREDRKNAIEITLELIDKNVIEELSNLYGVKLSVRDPKKSKRKDRFLIKRRKSYYVNLCSDNAIHYLKRIHPYMIEKRRVVEKIAKIRNFELNKMKPHQGAMFYWLAGYFDAEGCIIFNHKQYFKHSNRYGTTVSLKWSTTNHTVARYVKRLLNRWFRSKPNQTVASIHKTVKHGNKKSVYQVVIGQAIKVFIFARVFKDIIKIKRKQDKFLKLIDYGNFCAQHKFKFGSVNFAKDSKRRGRWLEGIKSEME